ncbi:MAG: hypothetical protein KBF47_19430, partial [Gemmatimonadales bacterium]|nr:hypothetical protein [Gemmatimonadales bacterium]
PELRRWTQEDPIGYGGGVNLYAYVGGAVLEGRDPSGLVRDCSGGACGNPHDWSGVPGFDSYGGNLGGSGGTWGERASRQLQIWGAMQTLAMDLYQQYLTNYKRYREAYAGTSNPTLRAMFARAEALGQGAFARLVRSAQSILIGRDLSGVMSRLGGGEFLVSEDFVRSRGANRPAVTVGNLTALDMYEFRKSGFAAAWTANVLLHESLHAWDTYGKGSDEDHCMVYRHANDATGTVASGTAQACNAS